MLYLYAIWNIIVFIIYGADKHKAKWGSRRIPEKTLLSCALLMGGVGAGLGMLFFHHKTQKVRFTVLVPLFIGLNIVIIYVALRYVG